MSSVKPFEFFGHTADVGLVARGSSPAELFANAALGVMASVVDPATVRPGAIRERIRAEAADRETLLVNWLNEVLFLYGVQQMVFCRFHVREVVWEGPKLSIVAEGEGELLDPGRHAVLREVKSATFHALKIETAAGALSARVVLDV